jgi:hypothetical protein
MKKFLLVFIIFLFSTISAQDNIFSTESFIIKLTGRNLFVENLDREMILEQSFNNPGGNVADLDGDGYVEFILEDYSVDKGRKYYYTYVYNTIDSFYLIDSIYSGLKKPYLTYSYELNEVIIITGTPDTDSLNDSDTFKIFSPLICWGFADDQFGIINDKLYDIFIDTNNKDLDYIDSLYNKYGNNCSTARMLRSAIAAVFLNYIYADEEAIAEKALNKYYGCSDKEKFKDEIKKLL